jgi:hypothetical protein
MKVRDPADHEPMGPGRDPGRHDLSADDQDQRITHAVPWDFATTPPGGRHPAGPAGPDRAIQDVMMTDPAIAALVPADGAVTHQVDTLPLPPRGAFTTGTPGPGQDQPAAVFPGSQGRNPGHPGHRSDPDRIAHFHQCP